MYVAAVPPSAVFPANGGDVNNPPPPLVLTVPMALPTPSDDQKRAEIAARLGLAVDQVPTLRRDDTDLEIEWVLINGTTHDTVAQLAVNAANELFAYDPAQVMLGLNEDPPPSLAGGKPITVAAGSSVHGTIREDELSEAAQDLDSFTRGGVVAERAILTRWPTKDVTGGSGGELDFIPSAAIPLLISIQLSAVGGQDLTLEATLRVRDSSDRVRAAETDAAALVPASTNIYQPPAAMMKPTGP